MIFRTFAAPIAHSLRMLSNLLILKMIAITLGPAGLGELGNFMSLTSMMAIFTGGGIATGITKYVSEYKTRPKRMLEFLSSAITYGFIFSVLFFVAVAIGSKKISGLILGNENLYWLILITGIFQFFCFTGTAIASTANGLQRQDIFAVITITGYILIAPIAYLLISSNGVAGAAIALLLIASSAGIPALYFILKSPITKFIKLKINTLDIKLLARYSAMAIVSASMFPLSEIYIRSQIAQSLGSVDVGLWQGMVKLSGAYLGLFTLYLSTSYMPLLSSLSERAAISRNVKIFLLTISASFITFALVAFLTRYYLIEALYSNEFSRISEIIGWYLAGDLFRVCSYVIGFLGVAKAALRLYIFCELTQAALVAVASKTVLLLGGNLISIAQAYTFSYLVYFIMMLFFLSLYSKGQYDFSR